MSFSNCDSFLELKDPQNKYVTCQNNHTFCFLCLQKPHGKLVCDQKLDNSMIEFAKNNFVKKCPNCNIVTEKSSGCNHMTCTKCKFQWCWLCNGKYTLEHYLEGKCKGYQFFRPKDEKEIQLAFEGKIKLRNSQRQEDINNDIIVDMFGTGRHLDHYPRRRIIMRFDHDFFILGFGCGKNSLIFFIYLIIGHPLYSLISLPDYYMRNNLTSILFCISYFLMDISLFFPIIYFNIIMLLPYLINQRFSVFIYYCYYAKINSKRTQIYFGFLLLVLKIFFGEFFYALKFFNYIIRRSPIHLINIKIIFVFISIIFEIIYFPFQFILNQIHILVFIFSSHEYSFIREINNDFHDAIGIYFIEYEH